MDTKKVYINPGQLIEIRYVPDHLTPDAQGFRESARHDTILMQVVSEREIAFIHPMIAPLISYEFKEPTPPVSMEKNNGIRT